jgi:hypothetical protein
MAEGVIQAPKPELQIMRYELSDYEWTAIKPMLPNGPRGVSLLSITPHYRNWSEFENNRTR